MGAGLFLAADDLAEITGYKSAKGQCRWLTANHWKHALSASGRPVVAREYALQQLGVAGIGHIPEAGPQPNFAALGGSR